MSGLTIWASIGADTFFSEIRCSTARPATAFLHDLSVLRTCFINTQMVLNGVYTRSRNGLHLPISCVHASVFKMRVKHSSVVSFNRDCLFSLICATLRFLLESISQFHCYFYCFLAKRIIINLETDLNINHALTKLLRLKVVPLVKGLTYKFLSAIK